MTADQLLNAIEHHDEMGENRSEECPVVLDIDVLADEIPNLTISAVHWDAANRIWVLRTAPINSPDSVVK